MNRLFLILVFILSCISLNAQESAELIIPGDKKINPTVKTIFYSFPDNIIPLKISVYGERSDLVFINMHDDETTSVDAVKIMLEKEGGMLIEVENKLKRNIRFRIGSIHYTIDPNRVFSREGIKKAFKQSGKITEKAISEAEKFGQRLIRLIPENAACVIALHNNTPGLFSITDYAPGNERSKESKKVFINPGQDPDDFFLTTDKDLYENLSDKGYNAILQDNKNCTEDGSLSVYCGKRNIRYVNCETEHGKADQYLEMIKMLMAVLQEKKNLPL